MKPCKHGHVDGALHKPCYQCMYESALQEIKSLRREAKEFKAKTKSLTKHLDVCMTALKEEQRRLDLMFQWIEQDWYEFVQAHPEAAGWFEAGRDG